MCFGYYAYRIYIISSITVFIYAAQCPPGEGPPYPTGPCSPCLHAFYQHREDLCTPCPDGHTTVNTGSTSQSDCILCPAGKYVFTSFVYNDEWGTCRPCPYNQYKMEGELFCSNCPEGHTTDQTGATSSSECKPSTQSTTRTISTPSIDTSVMSVAYSTVRTSTQIDPRTPRHPTISPIQNTTSGNNTNTDHTSAYKADKGQRLELIVSLPKVSVAAVTVICLGALYYCKKKRNGKQGGTRSTENVCDDPYYKNLKIQRSEQINATSNLDIDVGGEENYQNASYSTTSLNSISITDSQAANISNKEQLVPESICTHGLYEDLNKSPYQNMSVHSDENNYTDLDDISVCHENGIHI